MTWSSWAGHLHWWWFSRSVVADSCDPTDCSLSRSSVLAILQARILECAAFPFSRGSSWRMGWTRVFWTAGRFYTHRATREAQSPRDLQQQQVAMKANGVLKLTLNPLFNLLSKPVFPTFPSSPHPCFWDPERSHPTEAFRDTVWSSVREKCEFRTDFVSPVFLRVDDAA